jgi:branched-chain amino acid transport system permease protein
VTVPIRRVAGLGIVALAALAPFGLGPDQTHDLANLLILVIVGVAWNLLAGYAGLISVGQQAFIGLGAYTSVWLDVHGSSPLLGVPLAALVCACAGLLVSVPIFRLRGGYFAIGTWVVAEVLRLLVVQNSSLGAGAGKTLTGLSDYDPAIRQANTYWVALAVVVFVLVGIALLLRSRLGLGLTAVRDDEVAAGALGVQVGLAKRTVYVLAAAGCGLAGGVLLTNGLRAQPDAAFSVQFSAFMIFMVVIGGFGTLEGPVLGALVFFILQQTLADYGSWYLVALGVAAIIITLRVRGGLWGLLTRRSGASVLPLRHRLVTPREGA